MYQFSELKTKLQDFSKLPSLGNFTLVMLIALGIISFLTRNPFLMAIPFVFILLYFLNKNFLAYFNILWFQFGIILAWLTSPLILALIYFLVITPFALIFRLFARKKAGWQVRAHEKIEMRTPY